MLASPNGQSRTVTIVRHGQTAFNAQHRFQGDIDIPLDETGLWQVECTGQALRDLYVTDHPACNPFVICSDLSRAQQTAHAFADPLGLEVHPDKRLRERNFGTWEGQVVEDMAAKYPEDIESWRVGGGGELKHGAEERRHVGMRGLEAISEWSRKAGPESDLFVFAHGALIEQTLQCVLGIADRYPDFISMATMRNAHWARLNNAMINDPDRWVLVDYNHGPAIADTPQWFEPHTR
ncbi:phosphoglycerate mutase [Bifidobacterium dolichotidis]|uniref:Phosphoglycerate mutase n=1 Tax=Bifidobacterium dolichotidis TaxID=2306976 RepID=A0A430FTA6_9BIFI|nr:histidine phosphatase family protein [Bifidobacterium dolichotidis]RSX56112.1 phosphoglycerate mutase [Bifidobacterium dolichotidis]